MLMAFFLDIFTRNTSSQGNESNGIDGVLEIDEAPEVTSNISDDCCAHANHGNGDDETGISVADACPSFKGRGDGLNAYWHQGSVHGDAFMCHASIVIVDASVLPKLQFCSLLHFSFYHLSKSSWDMGPPSQKFPLWDNRT